MSIFRFILAFLLVLEFSLPAWAEPAYRLQFAEPVAAELLSTPSDYWMETSFALVGSAAGNGVALLSFFLVDIAPTALSDGSSAPADLIGSGGALWLLLLLLPALTTPLTLQFFYPLPEHLQTDFWSTLLGSSAAVLLHAVLMIPLFFLAKQPSLSQSIYLIAPAALFSGILIEGLATAWFYDQSRSLRLEQADAGLKLVYHLTF
ncbi:hypothetical protein COW36_22290 [bacterium (Candidatus Blackallbacteria) CG17_big_fil_post_rev_8_21_14_2_50_48_46]|uniref:Uncharacterized protein n=1 Tax=bacterium (Candidatus Blackallbacteria) CG17_big_fil_post_rev_8_21_14_2_50_48_46 TaxID=2014261 RepID=A0A2M7FYE0_9BACT|nr:MAG: hypothetical protein COW64_13720 [bacterium (Candidatus Blackallbacteria) CG18_big_fil_WC_8_21_14_2_50_49_26]PIW14345.1 MAG: hypothetical protein COW36_22290 [bacterium (Candidatus Blackallbacteria) CG17_big_fil_post_rev_8_21_14_2_50_48_46]PIW45614.1 MAG: hypothetical protein COW20_19895 [bacterium (Candidatus Blackallbacteria) CG13_big_fil_rev_8_21_14_2_50_49_14]